MYVELYFSFIGNTAKYVPIQSSTQQGFQPEINIQILLKQNDTIVDFKKYQLKGPVKKTKEAPSPNFVDVQRFKMAFKPYTLDFTIQDANSNAKPIKYKVNLDFSNFYSDSIFFSGIEFASSIKPAKIIEKQQMPNFIKNDYFITPYVSDFFPESEKKLKYYLEIYNTDKVFNKEPFLLKMYLQNADNLEILPKYVFFERAKPTQVLIASNIIDIKNLPSGKYYLVFEIRNKKNRLITQQHYLFERSNPTLDKKLLENIQKNVNIDTTFVANVPADSLPFYISYLYPIADPKELNYIRNQTKVQEIKLMRSFLYGFWLKRNPKNPQKAWKQYLAQVKYVNKHFSTQVSQGYETDRGRVYLQYGPPDDILTEEHDPGLLPYEIWYYYHLKGQNSVKFVFYNPDLNYNGYRLLHSTARGEVYIPNWKAYLDKRSNVGYDPYNNRIGNYVGGHLDRDIMPNE